MASFNFSIHDSTNFSPFFLMYGRDPLIPMDLVLKSRTPKYNMEDNYVAELMARLNIAFTEAKQNLRNSAEKRAIQYNKKSEEVQLKVGDLVYLYDPSTKIGESKKLTKPWKGPFRIMEQKSPVNFKIKELNKKAEHIVHVNRLKLCKGEFDEPKRRGENYLGWCEWEDSESETDEQVDAEGLRYPSPQDVANLILRQNHEAYNQLLEEQEQKRKVKRDRHGISREDRRLMEENTRDLHDINDLGRRISQGISKSSRYRLRSQP